MNSSEIIVLPEENRVLLSQIFRWYSADFGGGKGMLEFIAGYMLDDDKKVYLREEGGRAKIDYLYYDWNLNR